MLPTQFLSHVEKLVNDAPILPEVPIFLMLVNYKLVVVTKNQLKRDMLHIFRFSRDQRQNGLTTSQWSTVFHRLLKTYNTGNLKEKYNGGKIQTNKKPVTAKPGQPTGPENDR